MLGTIKKKQQLEVLVKLTFFCTAKWIAQPLITASKQKEGTYKVHSPLDVKLDSMLSTRLSYDEVSTEGPPIGEGSYGTVYKGEWRGVPVAVKKLKVQDESYPEGLLNELQQEVDIMTTLRHPNIVNFIGASLVPGHLFLVTEFLPMGNLGQYLNVKSTIRVMLKVKIALDCARGMDFLHKCNILHRDLKPDNLLVVSMSRSAPTNVKLTDFGTARAVTLSITKATQMTVGLGTPIYMAPEVLHGDYDQKLDVFSFAILLYELCTQTTPYSRFSRGHKVTTFVDKGNRLEIPATVPLFFANMITRCWAENSADRPSFSEIVEELEQALFRRLPEATLSEELSEKESLRKINKEFSSSSIQKIKPDSVLANVFSPVSSHVAVTPSHEGTTTSSTFSNLLTFSNNTTTTSDSNNTNNTSVTTSSSSNNNTTNSSIPSSPPNEKDFVVCQVCHSKTSTTSSSKSSSGELVEKTGDVAHHSTSSTVVEQAIAALAGDEKAESDNQSSSSRRALFIREESKLRIERVIQTLAAGTIHAVDQEDMTRNDEELKQDPRELQQGSYPRHLVQQQHSHSTIERPPQASFAAEFPSREAI